MYDLLAEMYDLEHAGYREDVDLHLMLARASGGPVLELACGSGRLMEPLAEAGFQVTGIDCSAAMLARARSRLARFGASCRLRQAHIEAFEEPQGYSLAVIALDSFAYLLERRAQGACLRSVSAALCPGGLLTIDLQNPDLVTLAQSCGQLLSSGEFVDQARGRRVTRFSSSVVDVASQTQSSTVIYDALPPEGRGNVERTTAVLTTRFFFRPELELLLEDAGFAIEQLYGDYAMNDYGSDSPRLIVVGRRG